MRSMKNGAVALIAAASVMLFAPRAMAVFTAIADSWSESTSGDITVVHSGGDVTVILANYGGWPSVAEARLTAHATGDLLVGDYLGAGASSVSFEATVVGNIGGGTRVTIHGPSGRYWYNYTGTASGTISKDLSSPWAALGHPGTQVEWEQDLADVAALGVSVNRGDGFGQSYAITDFKLTSERAIGSLSPLEQALMDRFGVTSVSDINAADALVDTDGDGMTDLNEILAENDPEYYSEVLFLADVVDVTDTGVTLEWAVRAGGTYQIYKVDTLDGGIKSIGGQHTASETGYSSSVEPYDGPGAFYWVKWTNCP